MGVPVSPKRWLELNALAAFAVRVSGLRKTCASSKIRNNQVLQPNTESVSPMYRTHDDIGINVRIVRDGRQMHRINVSMSECALFKGVLKRRKAV